jgi:hypothetical protein
MLEEAAGVQTTHSPCFYLQPIESRICGRRVTAAVLVVALLPVVGPICKCLVAQSVVGYSAVGGTDPIDAAVTACRVRSTSVLLAHPVNHQASIVSAAQQVAESLSTTGNQWTSAARVTVAGHSTPPGIGASTVPSIRSGIVPVATVHAGIKRTGINPSVTCRSAVRFSGRSGIIERRRRFGVARGKE